MAKRKKKTNRRFSLRISVRSFSLAEVIILPRGAAPTPDKALARLRQSQYRAEIVAGLGSFDSCPIMQSYRTLQAPDNPGALPAFGRDKAPPGTHPVTVIRAEPNPIPARAADLLIGDGDALPPRGRRKRKDPKTPRRQNFAPPAMVPSWARATGRAGEGDALFAAGASLALLDAFLRRDPPCAGVFRQRLALQAAAASAKILRLRADADSLRDLRFAVTDDLGPSARLLELWRDLTARPPALDGRALAKGAAAVELRLADPKGLASTLREVLKDRDPVSAAMRAAAAAFAAFPDAPSAATEVLALWAFDLALAARLRWERPLPLIAAKILDSTLRPPGADRRAKPGEPGWERTTAAAIAQAAAAALDLGADLSRRADTLLSVAPRLRAKPAQKIVERLLAEDALAPGAAARSANMTERSARRLFERLMTLGAVRELSGRPTFRLYGL